MTWWFLALALAAPTLQIDVIVDEDPRPAFRPRVRPGPLNMNHGAIVIDGVREPAWDSTPDAPALLAFSDGPAAPDVQSKVRTTNEGLAIWLSPLPADYWASVLLDPHGAYRTWQVGQVGPRGQHHRELCTQPAAHEVGPYRLPPRTAPCERLRQSFAAKGKDGWELLLPWDALPPATSTFKVLLVVEGPYRQGGTWAVHGVRGVKPEVALTRAMRQPAGQFDIEVDDGRWRMSLTGLAEPEGAWRWYRWLHGTLLDEGRVVAQDGEAHWTASPSGTTGAVVVVRSDLPRPVAPGFLGWPQDRRPQAKLLTPVFKGFLALDFDAPQGAEGVRVEVRDARGVVLGTAELDLPPGSGVVRIDARRRWPEEVILSAPTLGIDAQPARLAGRTADPR